ncbi:UNVERIFIED_CONTAM: putative late blight resistance proteinR1A-10 [Sesamum calycinum]|uniref:Late blight resistance proteinR1A-10 n=1 Tax=Sesamum calycinum TaxID=2727403 RepID=A0AAW2K0B9_9LAMI
MEMNTKIDKTTLSKAFDTEIEMDYLSSISLFLKEHSESAMATAYADLVSLVQTIEHLQQHPRPPVSLDRQQMLLMPEDVIESHIVDQILYDHSTSTPWEYISSVCCRDFYQDLQKVIADMDLIRNEVIEIRERMATVQDRQQRRNSNPAGSFMSSSTLQGHKQAMVGCDDVLNELMDKLTGRQSDCRIIPIVGMGGIGKTTLARNAYENPLIVEYFDIPIWVTVSQEYNTREILLELVCQKSKKRKEALREVGNEGLGEMDEFSGEKKSWDLFCKIVFGEEGGCPPELEEIGKTIAKNCKGLPLSVIVIGGLLAKSEKARDYWEYIAENLSSIVNLEENCVRILYMSYKELPIHLKSCFLYMGVYPEDRRIRASRLRKLWVAEGLLKPISGKSLEEVAEEYTKDLIDRNLMMIDSPELGQDISSVQRRIAVLDQRTSKKKYDFSKVLHLAPLARSWTCDFEKAAPLASFRLLRVLNHYGTEYPIEVIFKQANLRYLACSLDVSLIYRFPSSMHLLWNLQTLIVKHDGGILNAPIEIWKMHQLKHVVSSLRLPDPPIATGDVLFYQTCRNVIVLRILAVYRNWNTLIAVFLVTGGEQPLSMPQTPWPCGLSKLKEIPSSFGEIQTLELIELTFCSDSAVISAKEIEDNKRSSGIKTFEFKFIFMGGSITLN